MEKPEPSYIRTCALLAMLVLVLVGVIGSAPTRGIYLALFFLASGLLVTPLARRIHVVWTGTTHLLMVANTRLLLLLVFLGVLTPLALLRRVLGKAENKICLRPGAEHSLFQLREHRFQPEDFEKLW